MYRVYHGKDGFVTSSLNPGHAEKHGMQADGQHDKENPCMVGRHPEKAVFNPSIFTASDAVSAQGTGIARLALQDIGLP